MVPLPTVRGPCLAEVFKIVDLLGSLGDLQTAGSPGGSWGALPHRVVSVRMWGYLGGLRLILGALNAMWVSWKALFRGPHNLAVGPTGDALSYHAGSPFSTRDHNPRGRPRPCAVAYTGAWWYRNCHYANLNGRYGVPYDHQAWLWGL